jgi:penicillin-insensitive murein endopeptidase
LDSAEVTLDPALFAREVSLNMPIRSQYRPSGIAYRWLPMAAALVLACASAQASPWSKVKATAPGPASAIGGAANGCIRGAEALPPRGEGFVSIRRHRNRFYGHPETIGLIRDLGAAVAARTGQTMMVGDLSQPRGGLMSSSHRSHQNGLDADIWFRLTTEPERAEHAHPEELDPASMVGSNGLSVNGRWGAQQRFLLKSAADDPRVDRIFVNPAIKRELCGSEGGDRAWLRKLRAWWGHDAHFHVRLKCPSGSHDCQGQAPVPTGEGCGEELGWWFSAEARAPQKKAAKPRPRPAPPAACQALLQGF